MAHVDGGAAAADEDEDEVEVEVRLRVRVRVRVGGLVQSRGGGSRVLLSGLQSPFLSSCPTGVWLHRNRSWIWKIRFQPLDRLQSS